MYINKQEPRAVFGCRFDNNLIDFSSACKLGIGLDPKRKEAYLANSSTRLARTNSTISSDLVELEMTFSVGTVCKSGASNARISPKSFVTNRFTSR